MRKKINYNINALDEIVPGNKTSLTYEQLLVYKEVLDSIIEWKSGKVTFLDASGGTALT